MKQILPYITSILLVILLGYQYFNTNKLTQKLTEIEETARNNERAVASMYIPMVNYDKITEDVTTELQPILEEINNRTTLNSSRLRKVERQILATIEIVGKGELRDKTDSLKLDAIVRAIPLLSQQIAMIEDSTECYTFNTFDYRDSTLDATIDVYMDKRDAYLSLDYKVNVGTIGTELYYPKRKYFGFKRPSPQVGLLYSNPNIRVSQAITEPLEPLKLKWVFGVGMMPGVSYIDGRVRVVNTVGVFAGLPIYKIWAR